MRKFHELLALFQRKFNRLRPKALKFASNFLQHETGSTFAQQIIKRATCFEFVSGKVSPFKNETNSVRFHKEHREKL